MLRGVQVTRARLWRVAGNVGSPVRLRGTTVLAGSTVDGQSTLAAHPPPAPGLLPPACRWQVGQKDTLYAAENARGLLFFEVGGHCTVLYSAVHMWCCNSTCTCGALRVQCFPVCCCFRVWHPVCVPCCCSASGVRSLQPAPRASNRDPNAVVVVAPAAGPLPLLPHNVHLAVCVAQR